MDGCGFLGVSCSADEAVDKLLAGNLVVFAEKGIPVRRFGC